MTHPEQAPTDQSPTQHSPTQHSPTPRPAFVRAWLTWTAGFVAFPIAGLVGTAVGGRVDGPFAALAGGAAVGVVIGAAQSLTSSRRLQLVRWTLVTGLAMSLGLGLGSAAVAYRTSLTDLALMGAITGLVLGVGQAVVLPGGFRRRAAWGAAMPLLWALGWSVTTLAGIDVAEQFTVFGASGAVTFMALSGLLLHVLLPVRAPAAPATSTSDLVKDLA